MIRHEKLIAKTERRTKGLYLFLHISDCETPAPASQK